MLGYLPGTHAGGVLAENVDPIEGQDDGHGPGQGLCLTRHPHFILRDEPWAWDLVDRFNLGEFNRGEGWALSTHHLVGPDAMSAHQVEQVETIIGVLLRRRARASGPIVNPEGKGPR
jgi:hypothetical protein